MARALEQIISELNNVYNPQRDIYNKQITSLDPQLQAEQKGLEFAKRDAFDQIDQGANRRGLFYSGIPIQEEQRYTGATYLPAVANMRAKYAQQKFNLQDALAKLTRDQYSDAYSIRQKEMDTEAAERAAAAARAASGGGGLDFGGYGGGSEEAPVQAASPAPQAGGVDKDRAYRAVQSMRGWSARDIKATVDAIRTSASRGNAYDKYKLELIASMATSNPNIRNAIRYNPSNQRMGNSPTF